MKRRLRIILQRNEGFFLPYTIILSMIILFNLTTMIYLYENNIYTNKTVNELSEIETLTQMTRAKFIQEKLYEESKSGETEYHHPSGDVHVEFNWIDDGTVEANTVIQTVEGTEEERNFRVFVTDQPNEDDE